MISALPERSITAVSPEQLDASTLDGAELLSTDDEDDEVATAAAVVNEPEASGHASFKPGIPVAPRIIHTLKDHRQASSHENGRAMVGLPVRL